MAKVGRNVKRPVLAMKRDRAERFPKDARIAVLDWDVSSIPGQVQFDLKVPGLKRAVQFATTPEDAYEFMSEIGHAFDKAVGI